MADMQIGDSGSDVKKLQEQINTLYGKKVVDPSGEFDDATAEKLAELQFKLGVGSTSGKADRKTMAALDDAMIPRTLIIVKGKKAWVTQEQYYEIMSRASAQAVKSVQPYLNLANSFDMLYKAHEDVRNKNKITAAMVDLATGAKFPSPQIAANAKRAANDILTAAQSLSLDPSTLSKKSQPIRDALAAMDQYRDETFVGGEQLIRELKDIQDAAVVTLKVLVAIKTGGASWGVQVSAAAGMGAYEGVLKEVDNAGQTGKFDLDTSALNVIQAAAVDGIVALILKGKGKGGLEKVVEDAIKKAAAKAAKGASQEIVTALIKYGEKALAGAAKNTLETALKTLPEIARMDKDLDPGKILDKLVDSFVTGLAMGALGEFAAGFSKGKIGKFGAGDVCKKIGEKDQSAKVKEVVETYIKDNGPKITATYIGKLTPGKSADSGIADAVMKDIVKSSELKKKVEEAKKKEKK